MHAFPFSLHDLAKDWLYSLSPGSLTTWEALQKAFLEKFFPASRIGSIRKEICGIRQHASESLYEYWERFKRLCASCPQHQISDQLLIQYFYEGLLPNDRGMIDAASGGALVDKTPAQAKELISNMAQNTQQHSVRNDVKRVNEIDLSGVKSQLQENAQQIATLTTLVSKLVGNESKARVCGICSDLSHPTNACPTLQTEDVNALGGSSVNILPNEIYMMYEFDSLQSTNHTLAMADNTEVKIVGVLNNALIRVKNRLFLDDFYVINTKHESTILLGRPFLKTSKALIDVANGSVVLESNGEKIELNMIDKDLIPEANATDYVANSLKQIGVDNLETILDGMVAEMGLEKLFTNALEEIDI
ncbi:Oligoribonuclease [Bienertia sinuspersici]